MSDELIGMSLKIFFSIELTQKKKKEKRKKRRRAFGKASNSNSTLKIVVGTL
jgi:hypothetical protein